MATRLSLDRPVAAGERRVTCGLCGMEQYRTKCRRLPGGMLACEDEPEYETGRDVYALSEERAAAAVTSRRRPTPGDLW